MKISLILGLLTLCFITSCQSQHKVNKLSKIEQLQGEVKRELLLKSAFYNTKTKDLTYSLILANDEVDKLYFPIIKSEPLYSMNFIENDDPDIPDSIFTSALYLKFFDDKKEELKLGWIFHYDPLFDIDMPDSLVNWYSMSSWEQKNHILIEDYKKKGLAIKDDYNWAIKYKLTKEEGIFLNKREAIKLALSTNLSSKHEPSLYYQDYNIQDEINKAKYMEVYIYIDSVAIKKELLLPKDVDSLQENNIKIFNGFLVSNQIELKTVE